MDCVVSSLSVFVDKFSFTIIYFLPSLIDCDNVEALWPVAPVVQLVTSKPSDVGT